MRGFKDGQKHILNIGIDPGTNFDVVRANKSSVGRGRRSIVLLSASSAGFVMAGIPSQ